jgi:hypothetical protein
MGEMRHSVVAAAVADKLKGGDCTLSQYLSR